MAMRILLAILVFGAASIHTSHAANAVKVRIRFSGAPMLDNDRVCFVGDTAPSTGIIEPPNGSLTAVTLSVVSDSMTRMLVSTRPELHVRMACNNDAPISACTSNDTPVSATTTIGRYYVLSIQSGSNATRGVALWDSKFGLFNAQCDLAADMVSLDSVNRQGDPTPQGEKGIFFQPTPGKKLLITYGGAFSIGVTEAELDTYANQNDHTIPLEKLLTRPNLNSLDLLRRLNVKIRVTRGGPP
jgi:hypothetical protein